MIFEDLGLKRLFDQGVPDAHLEAQEHKGGPLRWSFLEVKWSNKIRVFFFPAKTRTLVWDRIHVTPTLVECFHNMD